MSEIMNSNTPAAEEKTNSMLWEDLDPDAVRKEFGKVHKNLSTLAAEIKTLAEETTNFDQAKKALEQVRDRDLSASGWIATFIAENTSAFPGLNGDGSKRASKPDWYHILLPDKRKKYDEMLDFMDDAVKIKVYFKPFTDILRTLPLKDTFRVFAIMKHMKTKGWNETEYQLINKDIESVCALLKLSWGEMNSKAVLSERYYKENISRMDSPKTKEGYIKQRQEDYLELIKKYEIYKSLRYKGNGRYYIYGERLASMRTLDVYMGKLVLMKDLDDRLKTLVAAADKLMDALMKNVVLHTGAGQSLRTKLLEAITTLRFFVNSSLENFTKFKKGSEEAPYCFMKCPKAADSAQGWFGFSPKWSDSWSNGTGYMEIYRKALYGVMLQSHDFAYVHGRVQ